MSRFTEPPKKSLGQHFLHDRGIIEKIVHAVQPQPGDRLVEIGPGQGAITFPLLRKHGALTVIEFDRDLITPLMEASEGIGELTVIHKDVLKVDFGKLGADGPPIRLVGNLPYNISTPTCSTCSNTRRPCATCTSCCRRKWSSAWPASRAARYMAD